MKITVSRNDTTPFSVLYERLEPVFKEAWYNLKGPNSPYSPDYATASTLYSADLLYIFTCSEDDELCGYVILSPSSTVLDSTLKVLSVLSIYICPKYRDGRALRTLVRESKQFAYEKGYSGIIFALPKVKYSDSELKHSAKMFGELIDYLYMLKIGD